MSTADAQPPTFPEGQPADATADGPRHPAGKFPAANKLYQIADWDRHFENAKSRTLEHLSWCPMPNKQDGLSYRKLVTGKGGPGHYGTWCALILVCSKQKKPRNGILSVSGRADDKPLTEKDLELVTGMPAINFAKTLPILEAIGWIRDVPVSERCPSGIPEVSAGCPSSVHIIERKEENRKNGMEKKEENGMENISSYSSYAAEQQQFASRKEGDGNSRSSALTALVLKPLEPVPEELFQTVFDRVIRSHWPFTPKSAVGEYWRAVKIYPAGLLREAIDSLASTDARASRPRPMTPARLASECCERASSSRWARAMRDAEHAEAK